MKTNPYTSKILASLLSLGAITAVHAAPVAVSAGVGANTGINAGLGGGAGLGANSAFGGAAHAGGGFGSVNMPQAGVGAAAASARGSAATDRPDLGIDTSEFETIGMRQSRMGESTSSDVTATTLPAAVAARQHAAIAALSETNATEIRTATPATRAKVTADMTARMTGLAKALSEVKAHSASLTAEQRLEFNTAMKDVDGRAKTVKKDMKAAAKAGDDTRAEAQAKLAEDYEAYVQAAQHAEVIASSASTATVHTPTTADAGVAAQDSIKK